MRKVFLFSLSTIFFTYTFVLGQSFQKEIRFTNHLLNKKYFDEAIYTLQTLSRISNSSTQQDSINFLLGKTFYQMQVLDSSIVRFDKVSSEAFSLKSESVFFSAFNEAYLRQFENAKRKLTLHSSKDSLLQSLKTFELSGISLLQRNFRQFDSLNKQNSSPSFQFVQQREKMIYFSKVLQQKNKSPLKAALLSSIIPGAGKIYAGNKAQGIFNFLIAGIIGLQAWEGYNKDGPNSFRFIAYSSAFAGFYIANIWGSALSVKVKQREIHNSIDDQILFDMHIPIRSVFR